MVRNKKKCKLTEEHNQSSHIHVLGRDHNPHAQILTTLCIFVTTIYHGKISKITPTNTFYGISPGRPF